MSPISDDTKIKNRPININRFDEFMVVIVG